MRSHKIVYFSLDISRIKDFYQKASRLGYGSVFQLNTSVFDMIDEKKRIQNKINPQLFVEDLLTLLRRLDNNNDLYIIIDYISFFADYDEKKGEYIAYKEKQSLERKRDCFIVRKAILSYPEVDFLFDQSELIHHKELCNYIYYLSDGALKNPSPFHIFSWDAPFVQIIQEYSNIFDASKLRLDIKQLEMSRLGMSSKRNFSNLQDSRDKNLALSIEEEHHQNRFNCYALYVCGYRVIPVHTSRMLLMLNNCYCKYYEKPSVIIRDGDLQFPDTVKGVDYDLVQKKNGCKKIIYYNIPDINSDGFILKKRYSLRIFKGYNKYGESYVTDCIRDWKYDGKEKKWDPGFPASLSNQKSAKMVASINPFWNSLIKETAVFFITNGHEKMTFRKRFCYLSTNHFTKKKEVTGIQKPVLGLYYPFLSLKDKNGIYIIKETLRETRYKKGDINYLIDKTRDNSGGHGVPPDVYDMVDGMIRRAECYYRDGHYIRAAIVAQEALEILNGFHPQMMLRAYHIKAIAENAMALDVIGANEEELENDAIKRIEYIKEDVRRLVSTIEKRRVRKQHMSQILDHIFSDCRAMCRDNEYHSVESVFISAIAHGNDGFWTILK